MFLRGLFFGDAYTPELPRDTGLGGHPGIDPVGRPVSPYKYQRAPSDAGATWNEWSRTFNLATLILFQAVCECRTPTPRWLRVLRPFNEPLAGVTGIVPIDAG